MGMYATGTGYGSRGPRAMTLFGAMWEEICDLFPYFEHSVNANVWMQTQVSDLRGAESAKIKIASLMMELGWSPCASDLSENVRMPNWVDDSRATPESRMRRYAWIVNNIHSDGLRSFVTWLKMTDGGKAPNVAKMKHPTMPAPAEIDKELLELENQNAEWGSW